MSRLILIQLFLPLTLALTAAGPALAQSTILAERDPAEPLFQLDESTRKMLDRSQARIEGKPDGTVVLNANGGHQHVYMARVGKDGKIETFCAESVRAAENFLRSRDHSPELK